MRKVSCIPDKPQDSSSYHFQPPHLTMWVSESEYLEAHKISHYAPRCHLNKNDFSCRRNSPMSLSGWQILAGRLFKSRGPVAAKLRSPNRVMVRGTQHVSMSADRSRRRPAWETSWVIVKIRCRCIMKCLVDQEGQLSRLVVRPAASGVASTVNTGVMWSRRRVPVSVQWHPPIILVTLIVCYCHKSTTLIGAGAGPSEMWMMFILTSVFQ